MGSARMPAARNLSRKRLSSGTSAAPVPISRCSIEARGSAKTRASESAENIGGACHLPCANAGWERQYGAAVRHAGEPEPAHAIAFDRMLARQEACVFCSRNGSPLQDEGYGMDLPLPRTTHDGEVKLFLPPSLAAKASVYVAWKAANLSKVAFAERMGRSEGEVRRILDPHHGTNLNNSAKPPRHLGAISRLRGSLLRHCPASNIGAEN